MANVIQHPYEGSDIYCERCQLPPQNRHHTQGDVIAVLRNDLELALTGVGRDDLTPDEAAAADRLMAQLDQRKDTDGVS